MKIKYINISLIIIFFPAILFSQENKNQNKEDAFPEPFNDGPNWGYKNADGEIVIPAKFAIAFDFSEYGIAAVVDSTTWYYINTAGKVLVRPFIFDNGPDYFEEDLARCIEADKIGFFNRSGKIVIPPKFDYATSFHEGLAAFCTGCRIYFVDEHYSVYDGNWGYIDKTGEIAIEPVYEAARFMEDGKAKVKLNNQWIYIDKNGKKLDIPVDTKGIENLK